MFFEPLAQDIRYAYRGVRRSPLFAFSVAGILGVGLGVLCAWLTIVNAYLFKSVQLPQPTELHGLSWDSKVHDRYRLTLAEFEALAADTPVNGTLLDGVARTSVYFPAMATDPEAGWLLVRTHGDAAVPESRIAEALHTAHPRTAIEVGALREHAAVQVWSFQLFSTASGLPAAIGLLLACAGVYGVVAFLMAQRTREFGIRMALGATSGRIVRNVLSTAIRTATLAAVLGLCGTAGLMRGAAAISGLEPVISPSIYIAGAVIVVVASAVASLIPAMRATKLDPAYSTHPDQSFHPIVISCSSSS